MNMSLSAAVWPQFATQYLGKGTPVGREGRVGNKGCTAVDRLLINVCSLLTVTIPLIQFGHR